MDKNILRTQIKGTQILKVFIFIIGIVFIFFSYKEINFRISFLKQSDLISAIVLSVEQKQLACSRSSQCNASQNPDKYGWATIVVSYVDIKGQKTFGSTTSIVHNFITGIKSVNIYVSKTEPIKILVANPLMYWFDFIIYLFLGVAFIAGSFAKTIWTGQPKV